MPRKFSFRATGSWVRTSSATRSMGGAPDGPIASSQMTWCPRTTPRPAIRARLGSTGRLKPNLPRPNGGGSLQKRGFAELALLADAVVGHPAGGAPDDADETALRIPPHFLHVGHRLRLPRSQIDQPVLQLGPTRRAPRSR